MMGLFRAATFRGTAAVALGVALAAPVVATSGWTTHAADTRRTAQGAVLGPSSPAATAKVELPQEIAINVPPSATANGTVLVGTWGVIRNHGSDDRRQWDKSDGKVYAFRSDLSTAWDTPFAGDPVPYCYDYEPHEPTPGHCPGGGTVSFYNGTFEGTAAFDATQSTAYFGRGDGKLYSIDLATGEERWAFATFNPEDPADPDGGGEVVGGPLVGPDGTIYFATVAAGDHETNAIYAVDPEGELRWRFPHAEAGWRNLFWAPLALSPGAETLYAAGSWGPTAGKWDTSIPGTVLAFDLAAAGDTGDQRLKWAHEPINEGEWWLPTVWPTRLAVGSDGTLYAAGPMFTAGGGSAVLFALRDLGDRAEPAWDHMVDLDRGRAAMVFGLALREIDGVTTRVYATSGNAYSTLPPGYQSGGKLYALDPGSGEALWSQPFDPEAHGGFGSMTGIALDAAGTIFTGASGHQGEGKVFAIGEDGTLLWEHETEGLLEWGHPVLGPEGNLYFADTRRCPFAWMPIESGGCDGYDIDPALYAVYRSPPGETCVPGETTLCLNQGRFRVELTWTEFQGGTGPGRVVPHGTSDSGLFWFFAPENWEMLVKVLDGCAWNDRYWVFAAALTNVQYTLVVTDTMTGARWEHTNPLGVSSAAITDTGAFDTCSDAAQGIAWHPLPELTSWLTGEPGPGRYPGAAARECRSR